MRMEHDEEQRTNGVVLRTLDFGAAGASHDYQRTPNVFERPSASEFHERTNQ